MSEEEASKMAAALGMSTFQAQALEYSLVSLYAATFLETKKKWETKIQELMDTRYKHTLGRLINDAQKDLAIPEDLSEDLAEALQLRNWVTHHFFREYGVVGSSEELMNRPGF